MNSNKTSIRELFLIPKDLRLSEADTQYYSSLTPSWDILKQTRYIKFSVGTSVPADLTKSLGYQNNINVHIFKPKYFATGKEVTCFCANREVLAHTLRGIAFVCHHLNLGDIEVEINYTDKPLGAIIKGWEIAPHLIFCRIESFLTYLMINWLENKDIPQNLIEKLVIDFEMSRLGVHHKFEDYFKERLNQERLSFEEFESFYQIKRQPSSSPYIYSLNAKINEKPVTLVQLTWGRSLSESLLREILASNPNVISFSVIGGVGYKSNTENAETDDIFIPTQIVKGSDAKGYQVIALKNTFDTLTTRFQKKVIYGGIKSVTPEIGKISNTADIKNAGPTVTAIDMEFEGFWDALSRHPGVTYKAIYYIMDIPLQGKPLGKTYYDRNFLTKLFGTFNRGKFYCFEKICRSL